MARSSNSSACTCAGSARTRSTSASVNRAEKTRRATGGLVRAAATVRELFVRAVNEVIRHAMKPNIPSTIAKNTPIDTAEGGDYTVQKYYSPASADSRTAKASV